MSVSSLCLAVLASTSGVFAGFSALDEFSPPGVMRQENYKESPTQAARPQTEQNEASDRGNTTAQVANDEDVSIDESVSDETSDQNEVTVIGKRLPGSVRSDVEPVRTFSPFDIRAFGASSIQDLVEILGNEVGSDRAAGERQPIVLLNGRRLSSFDEIAQYPPEAIERAEIFPEELALEYGFPPNQKVVNLVTYARFIQKSGITEARGTIEGAGLRASAAVQLLRIVDDLRISGNIHYSRTSRIQESQRDIEQPEGLDGQAQFRSLVPRMSELGGQFGLGGVVFGDVNFSLSARGRYSVADASLGLVSDEEAFQRFEGITGDFGGTLSGAIARWQWTSSSAIRIEDIRNIVGSGQQNESVARSAFNLWTLSSDLDVSGPFVKLPAGHSSMALRAAYRNEHIEADQRGAGPISAFSLGRQSFEAFGGLNFPISKKTVDRPFNIGNLSIGAHGRFKWIEDRPGLADFGANLVWSPSETIRISLSREDLSAAPTLTQLGAPSVNTPNVRVFDFSQFQTVDISQITGGNDTLRNEKASLFNATVIMRPFEDRNFSATVVYSHSRIEDEIVNFPVLTAQLQQAFPDRFGLADDGRLTQIDARAINLFDSESKKLTFGLSWVSSIGKSSSDSRIGVNPNPGGELPSYLVPPNAKIVYAPPGTPLPPDLINALSRIFISLNYTRRLEDKVALAQGQPSLDLLDGFSLSELGGLPVDDLRISAGVFRRGLGLRVDVNWRSDSSITSLRQMAPAEAGSLEFDFKPRFDLQIFLYPQDRIVGTLPRFFQNLQLAFEIKNAFNTRPLVRDQTGFTPLRYQSAYLEPLGTTFGMTVRKLF